MKVHSTSIISSDVILEEDVEIGPYCNIQGQVKIGRGTYIEGHVTIGSRYVSGGGMKDWPLQRRLMSWGVNTYARWLLGLRPKDCSGAFRCFRVDLLRKVNFESIRSRGYSFQEEILWHLKRAGARFVESPILFADREKGQSKINSREALSAIGIIFRLGIRNWLGI